MWDLLKVKFKIMWNIEKKVDQSLFNSIACDYFCKIDYVNYKCM